MAVSGLLCFFPEPETGRSPFLRKRFKYCGREKLNLQATNLSSLGSLQEPWNLYLANTLKRPICFFSYRCRPVSCHSSLLPVQKIADSCIEGASAILTRYNSLRGNPATIKLVSAVGVIAFALWGLGPLVRSSRNNILHNSDNNWNRSNTHYALTSYLQPVFLWIGAMLVCRALDPIIMPSEASNLVKQRLLSFVRSLSTVLAFACSLSCAIKQAQTFALEKSGPSDSRNMGFQFAGKAVHSAVWVAAVSLFMELLGFSTQRWATAGGLGTVLITLAGREIFTNFLSSMMIHATRPFVVNEWIQTKIGGYDVSGTVEHVGWWSSTMIRSEDLEAVHIPSHKFTVNVVRNLTQRSHWRIKTHIAVSHLDVNKINNIVADMRKVLAKNPQVEQKRLHRRVFLENVNPENQALLILVSCFVKTSYYEEYLCVKEAILLDLLRVISHHQARLATPIRTIQKIYRDTNLENVSFSESAFFRGGEAATNQPYLIVEPSYKISGEERSKSSSRSAQSSKSSSGGDQVSQITGQRPSSDSSSETSSSSGSSPSSETQSEQGKKPPVVSSPSSETKSEQGKKPPVVLPTKPRPALEENIVLGVALEGSKRTLPIDEDSPDSDPSPAVKSEPEVVAKSKNGDGKGSGKKGVRRKLEKVFLRLLFNVQGRSPISCKEL